MSPFVRLQKLLPQHGLSRAAGALAASEGWVRGPLIRAFARAYGIDMSQAERPDLGSYRSFNDFFSRALAPGARPIGAGVVSPADGAVSQTGTIQDGRLIQAKGIRYSFAALADACASPAFEGGAFVTITCRRATTTASTCRWPGGSCGRWRSRASCSRSTRPPRRAWRACSRSTSAW